MIPINRIIKRFTFLVALLLVGAGPVADRALPGGIPPLPSTRSFAGWVSLGKPADYSLDHPFVGNHADGRIALFAMGSNSQVWYKSQGAINGAWSAEWTELTGDNSDCAAVGHNLDGRMELIALQSSNSLWYTWQSAQNSTFESFWYPYVAPPNSITTTCPQVNRNQDGRLEVFTIGSDGNVWSIWQSAANNGWESWSFFSKPVDRTISSLSMGRELDGRMCFYVLGDDGAIHFRCQESINDGWGEGWYSLGKPADGYLYAPAAGRNLDGRQEVFAVGVGGNLWHNWQVEPNGDWSAWDNLGQPTSCLSDSSIPVVGTNQDGTMEVFARTDDNTIWHIGQTIPNNGWGNWGSLGQPSAGLLDQEPAAGQQKNGQLILFAAGADGAIWLNKTLWSVYLPLIHKQ
jgi:hypothetical protein